MTRLTVDTAAARLGLSPQTVRKMAKRHLERSKTKTEWGMLMPIAGELPAVRLGHPERGLIVIPLEALERMGL